MKYEELVKATGVADRQIRYLIAEGFVPPPSGGRTDATYGEEHVTAVRRYGRLRELGFPAAAIRLLLGAREGVPVPIIPGVTLVIAPHLIAIGLRPGALANDVAAKIADLTRREYPLAAKPRPDPR